MREKIWKGLIRTNSRAARHKSENHREIVGWMEADWQCKVFQHDEEEKKEVYCTSNEHIQYKKFTL